MQEGVTLEETCQIAHSRKPQLQRSLQEPWGTTTSRPWTQGGIYGLGKAKRCYFGSRYLSQNSMVVRIWNDKCKPKPSITWCTYTFLPIYHKLLSCSSSFFGNTAEVIDLASSQDLLVAGHPSLTSSTRNSWLGLMSESLTCIHLGYLPNALVLPKHYRNWKTWITARNGRSKSCKGRLDWNLVKDRASCHGSLAPKREIGSAQFDLLGIYSQNNTASSANRATWMNGAIF